MDRLAGVHRSFLVVRVVFGESSRCEKRPVRFRVSLVRRDVHHADAGGVDTGADYLQDRAGFRGRVR